MREKNLVRTERVDQVLVIWIDNPPINAGSGSAPGHAGCHSAAQR